MVFLRRIILPLVAALFPVVATAQTEGNFGHYFNMEPAFNPAAVGKEAKLNVTAAYQYDFMGFENNPKTMYAAADMPFYALRTYQGVGVKFVKDQAGLFDQTLLGVQYALRFRLFGGMLGVGVQAGFLTEKFDGSKADVAESGDPAIPSTQVDGNTIDLGAGLYYQHASWYAGVSVQHVAGSTVDLGETYRFQLSRTYYLTGGCNIKSRNPFLTIHPSALVKYDGVKLRGDITARLVYRHDNKMLYAGMGYSPENSVTAMLGGSFHGINIGYSYEMFTNGIGMGNGSHGLFVNYQTDINLFKKGKNKHKSVRIL